MFPCRSDKAPLIKNRRQIATTDEATIRSWWDDLPEALVAIPAGAGAGRFAIDLDVKNVRHGMAIYRDLGAPKTELAVLTLSGGGHAYFR